MHDGNYCFVEAGQAPLLFSTQASDMEVWNVMVAKFDEFNDAFHERIMLF